MARAWLIAVELDEASLARPHPLIESERNAAIRDLVGGETLFRPLGRQRGRFRLRLSVEGRRLILAVADRRGRPVARHGLPLTPLARLIRDYFLIVESFSAAIASAPASRIEALDMARRGLHDEGAAALSERLAGKIEVDPETARRLFTLACALRWKG